MTAAPRGRSVTVSNGCSWAELRRSRTSQFDPDRPVGLLQSGHSRNESLSDYGEFRQSPEAYNAPVTESPLRPQQHRLRDREAERLGGLEVDGQFERRRQLNGKVAGLRAAEYLVYIASGAT